MNIIKLSWKNIVFKPWSLVLSMVLFGLGIGLIIFLFLLNNQLQDKFDKNLAEIDLVVGAKGSPLQLILCNMYHVDAPTGNIPIQSIKPFLNPNHPLIKNVVPLSLGDSYNGYRIVGTTFDFLDLYNAELDRGEHWYHDFDVVIGSNVAKTLGLKIGDEFQSSHGLIEDPNLVHDDAHGFKVIGVLKSTGSVIDQLILTSPKSIWDVHDHQGETTDSTEDGHEGHDHAADDHDHSDHQHSAEEAFTNADLLENSERDITSLLIKFKGRNYQALNMQRSINENTDMQAATPAIEINRLYSLMGVGLDALRAIAILISFVSGLSIFISLYNSLKERKYELALMRVMGSSQAKLFSLITMEGVLLALLGFIFGFLLAHGGMELMSEVMREKYRYNFSGWIFLKEELWVFLGALIVGLIASLIPAWAAYRTDIANTLADG